MSCAAPFERALATSDLPVPHLILALRAVVLAASRLEKSSFRISSTSAWLAASLHSFCRSRSAWVTRSLSSKLSSLDRRRIRRSGPLAGGAIVLRLMLARLLAEEAVTSCPCAGPRPGLSFRPAQLGVSTWLLACRRDTAGLHCSYALQHVC